MLSLKVGIKQLLLFAPLLMLSVDSAKWMTRFNLYAVNMNQDVVMECDIGDANFTGFFRLNEDKIEDTDRIKISQEDNIVTLDMSRVNEADFGDYICKDSNNGSDTAKLEINVLVEPNPESPQILLVGDPGKVQIRVYGKPKPSITWYITRVNRTKEKIASVDASDKMIVNVDGMYEIDQQGSLIIKKIRAIDAGRYDVIISRDGARDKGHVTVKVEFKLELKTKPPKSFVRAVGQELFIPCEWLYADTEFPRWTVTTKKGTLSVIKNGISKKGLLIAAVSMTDAGIYTCAASNKYGNESVTSDLKEVIDPANITTDFENVIKRRLETSYELVCEAAGKPEPIVKLSKLKKDKSGFDFIEENTGRVAKNFPKLGITDGGLYRCHADNGAKTLDGASMAETKNITLEVFAPTEIDEKSTTTNIVSAIGRPFTIKCTAKGYPHPQMKFLGNGKIIAIKVSSVKDVVTAILDIKNATQLDFAYKEVLCIATNAYGSENKTIPIKQILKAPHPKKLKSVGYIGLTDIDLTWDPVAGADKYKIFINDTKKREIIALSTTVTINKLKRKTYYSIRIASVNLAGTGNLSDPFNFETADIIQPNAVTGYRYEYLTSQSARIVWNPPANVDSDLITYHTKYCEVKNETESEDCSEKEKKESKLEIKDLSEKTKYLIQVIAINQGKKGLAGEPFYFTTKESPPPTEPTRRINGGLSSGEIAGIIVAIILIILIVVDLFCCFFNNCGFSHCCFETFCAAKDKKFLPVETTEGYGAQELDEKPLNAV